MENLLIYFLKLTVCSGVMFLYYQLSLKDKTFHHYNRFYLLATMLVSLFLPLLKIEDFTIEVSDRIYLLLEQMQSFKTPKNINNDHIYFRIIFSALGLVSFFFVAKILIGIFKIQKLKNSFRKEQIKGINFYQTDLTDAPFSYFRNLFWKDSITLDSAVGKQILKHEMVHIEQKHSIDKILAEVITAVFWFNPFFYLIKKEISLIHEYLADNKAVEKKDTKAFAQMLLTSHFSGTAVPAASPFLNSNLKKRLQMLQKPNTKFGYARRIMALPIVFTVAFAYLVNAKNTEIRETNIEIEKAFADLKRDTISPKNETDRIVQLQEEKISKANEKLKIQSEKLNVLSQKSKEKAAELQKIAKEKGEKSYDFELKAKELKQLSGEMDKVANKVIEIEKINSFSPNFDGLEGMMGSLEKRTNLEDILNSQEFKERSGLSEDKIKSLKKAFGNSLMQQYGKIDNVYLGDNLVYGKSSNRINANSKLSKKDLKKLEQLAKEKAELSKKQAEISRKEAAIIQENVQNNPWMISVDAHPATTVNHVKTVHYTDSPKYATTGVAEFRPNKKIIVRQNADDNPTYYVNGKEITDAEFKELKPNDIKKIDVIKNNNNGKRTAEVRVETK